MLVYLASPYSCKTKEEREERFTLVCRKAAELMLAGYHVFCPIAHSHPIEVHGMDHIEGHDFWLGQDFAVLEHCEQMFVYKMPGWEFSRGVAAEIQFCNEMYIPITYIDFKGDLDGKARKVQRRATTKHSTVVQRRNNNKGTSHSIRVLHARTLPSY